MIDKHPWRYKLEKSAEGRPAPPRFPLTLSLFSKHYLGTTKPLRYAPNWKVRMKSVGWCVSFRSPSSNIYRCGTTPLGRQMRWTQLEPTLGANEESPCWSFKSVELILVPPTHLVRPNQVGLQPAPSLGRRLAGGPSSPWQLSWRCPKLVFLLWWALWSMWCWTTHSDWSVLLCLGFKGVISLHFCSNSCIAIFSRGHVELILFWINMHAGNASSPIF
jgi:hypothetical protein